MRIDRVNIGPQLAAITTGFAGSGLLFCGWLSAYLDPSRRSLSPDLARGYASLVQAKHGDIYGTHFEQLAVNPGPALMIMILLFSAGFEFRFFYVEGRPRPLRLYFASAALSMAAFVTLWILLP
jgi:hypothetical protein